MKYLLYIFISASMLSCSPEENIDASFDNNTNLSVEFSALELNDFLARPPIDVPEGTVFYQNVPYGANLNQVVDIFLPQQVTRSAAIEKTKVVLQIHGGGFVSGDKATIYQNDNDIYQYLENNIAFISMNYRFVEDNNPDNIGVLKSFSDSEKVLRFIRKYSNLTNLNWKNIFLKGESSGAGIAQYLISKSKFSSKIKGASLTAPQATYDFLEYNELFMDFNFDLYQYLSASNLENRIINFYGGSHIDQLENDNVIIDNRKKVSLSKSFKNYSGRLRVVAGNVGIPYQSLGNLNELLHHQLQAIMILKKATAHGVYIDAEIPHLNLENSQSELDFILDSF